jgi:hypothetical protein
MKGSTVLTECACGRSPIGICIGWHELDEKQYTVRLAAWKKNQAEKDKKLIDSIECVHDMGWDEQEK